MIRTAVLALSVSLFAPCGAMAARVFTLPGVTAETPRPDLHASAEQAAPPLPPADFQDLPPAAQQYTDASIARPDDLIDLDVHYPVFGNAPVDQDLALWAHRVVDTFTKGLGDDHLNPRQFRNELKAVYTVSSASPRSLTVTYEVWSYAGGVHGNNDIITLSYDLERGQRLFLEDLFTSVDTALERLESYCSQALRATLGENLDEEMLKSGTAPELVNYAGFSLFPAGLRIHFQPYQVAPFAAGAQQVDVPLEAVQDAGPHLELWGKK